MLENPIIEFFAVIAIFIGMVIGLFAISLTVTKLRLYNNVGLLFSSAGISLIFSIGSFAFIALSKKFANWTIDAKLKYSGEIFIFLFIVLLFIISGIFSNRKKSKSRD